MKVRKIKIGDRIVTYAAEENGCWVLANGNTVDEKDVKIIDMASDEIEELFKDVLANLKEKEKVESEFVAKQNEIKEKNKENDRKLKEMLHIMQARSWRI